ncbi:MAG: hypothetical protein GY778_16060 [bacterium]|nr:hypothetical protein [bacterium]
MVLQTINVRATFEDEITSRARLALDTMVEFGATADQVAKSLALINSSAETGARGMAQTANVLRTLVDESEDAARALKSVGKAFDIAADRGIKAEDAGRGYGKILKGDVSILREYGGATRQAAMQLDRITDPQRRAALGQEILNARMRQGPGLMDRMRDRAAGLNAKLASMGLGFITVERAALATMAAITALTAATVRYVNEGIKKATEHSKTATAAFDAQTAASNRLQTAIGDVVIKSKEHQRADLEYTARLRAGAKYAEDNQKSLSRLVDKVVRFGDVMGKTAFTLLGVQQAFGTVSTAYDDLVGTSQALEDVTRGVNLATANFSGTISSMVGPMNAYTGAGNTAINMLNRLTDAHKREQTARDNQLGAERKAIQQRKKDNQYLADWEADQAHRQDKSERPGKVRKARGGGGGGGGGSPARGVLDFEATQQGIDAHQRLLSEVGGDGLSDVLRGGRAEAELRAQLEGMMGAGPVQVNMGAFEEAAARAAEVTANARREIMAFQDALLELVNGAVMAGVDAFGLLFENMAAGENVFKGFGAGLVAAAGDLLVNFGKATLMTALMVQAIETGILSPAATIGLALTAIALGSTLKGFQSRDGGGSTSTSASSAGGGAVRQFNALADRNTDRESRVVHLHVDGRQMNAYITDSVNDGHRRGRISTTSGKRT